MTKYKSLLIIVMTILVVSLISFVIIMQYNFMNPDFATAEVTGEETKTEQNITVSEDEEAEEEESTEETETDTVTTKYVVADIMNVRKGPGTDTEIVGYVTLNQEVEVEGPSNSDGWVKITTDEYSGYVNEKYLEDK